jgi:hypothetical protein
MLLVMTEGFASSGGEPKKYNNKKSGVKDT